MSVRREVLRWSQISQLSERLSSAGGIGTCALVGCYREGLLDECCFAAAVGVAVEAELRRERPLEFRVGAGLARGYVRIAPLPHLQDAAVAAARRPAHVVVLADRDGTAIIAHPDSDPQRARRYDVGLRPGMQPDPRPGRPPAQHHGERHVTDREPESGGERNAELTAGRVSEAAASVGAHIVLGAGDQHILDAISSHLPFSLGPVTTIATGPVPRDSDGQLTATIGAALDGITADAIDAVAGLIAAGSAAGPDPAAVRGPQAVAAQLAERQVAVLLVADDSSPDEMVWDALHQDAIVAQLPARPGPLAGELAAALLRRGAAS